jgi:transposase-like protein
MTPEPTTYGQLAKRLGVDPRTLRAWRNQPDAPQDKNVKAWQTWRKNRAIVETRGRPSGHASVGMDALRQRLVEEQGRKEAALASLRELELYQKQNSLIPESEAIRVVVGLLTPLRSLLDSMARQVSAQCNPAEPAIAELAIRNYLDERIYTACQKIMADIENEFVKS